MTTTVQTPIPNPKDVRDLLNDLLGRDVDVTVAGTPELGPKSLMAIAVYVDNSTRSAALVSMDLKLAASVGAAIGLIPKGGAEVCVEDSILTKPVSDNLYEVLNICASLFNAEGAPHLKIYGVHSPGESVPTDVAAGIRALGRRLDLEVDVAGYFKGHMSLVLV